MPEKPNKNPDKNLQSIKEALKESEIQYRTTIDSMADPIHVVDEDLRFVMANNALENWNRELHLQTDVVGKSVFEVYPFLGDKVKKEYEKVFNTGEILVTQETNKLKSGEFITEIRKIPIFQDKKVIQVITLIRNITGLKKSESRLSKLTECFLNFETRPDDNINKLVGLCGELMGADCALYHRLEDGMLKVAGKWNIPSEESTSSKPDGHICYDVINKGSDEPWVIRDLQNTNYAKTDPNVVKYKLKTYAGVAVKFAGICISSLCAVYREDFILTEEDKKIMQIIASAVATEEKRRQAMKELFDSEEKYRFLFQESPAFSLIIGIDGLIKDANNSAVSQLGFKREDVLNKSALDFVILEDRHTAMMRIEKSFRNQSEGEFEVGIKASDGSVHKILFSSGQVIFYEKDKPISMLVTGIDITDRKDLQDRQSAMAENLRAVVSMADELIACSNIETLFKLAVELCRGKLGLERCAIFIEEDGLIHGIYGTDKNGCTTDESAQKFPKDGPWRDYFKLLKPNQKRWFIAQEPRLEWDGAKTVKIGEGWVAITPIQSSQKAIGVFVNDSAITNNPVDNIKQETLAIFCSILGNIIERKWISKELENLNKELFKSNQRLRQLALRDSHTGLYNHRYMQEALEAEFCRASRYSQNLTLIMLDLDYFKSINDVYGHPFGDLVLKQFAKHIEKIVRKYDIVIRFGGEEFIIISPGIDRIKALGLAKRILETNTSASYGNKEHMIKLKITAAIATYPEDNIVKGMDMVELADKILNKAKIDGGDRVYCSIDLKREESDFSEETQDAEFFKEKIDRLNKRANQGIVEAIFAFAKTLELKDHYTGEHVERTVRYSVEIARNLKLNKTDIEKVKWASMVHDLGKIGISERILLKRSKLSDSEYNKIKRHPQIGADILRPVHSFSDIIPLVLHHHERWDGQGYPSGLEKEAIPVGARILAIADVYQALTSDRPYRKAYSEGEASQIIQDGAGSQFDPKIVQAFLEVTRRR